jgi:hypothetical protein
MLDLFEARFGFRPIGVVVGMKFYRKSTVGLFDLSLGRPLKGGSHLAQFQELDRDREYSRA